MVKAGNEETNSLRHCLAMVFTTCHLAYVSNDIMCMTDYSQYALQWLIKTSGRKRASESNGKPIVE